MTCTVAKCPKAEGLGCEVMVQLRECGVPWMWAAAKCSSAQLHRPDGKVEIGCKCKSECNVDHGKQDQVWIELETQAITIVTLLPLDVSKKGASGKGTSRARKREDACRSIVKTKTVKKKVLTSGVIGLLTGL